MRYQIDPEKIVWRNIDDEAIILNLDSGVYYGLNKTGSLIWTLLSQKSATENIIGELSSSYGISKKQATQDVLAMLEGLAKESLISPQENSTPL